VRVRFQYKWIAWNQNQVCIETNGRFCDICCHHFKCSWKRNLSNGNEVATKPSTSLLVSYNEENWSSTTFLYFSARQLPYKYVTVSMVILIIVFIACQHAFSSRARYYYTISTCPSVCHNVVLYLNECTQHSTILCKYNGVADH